MIAETRQVFSISKFRKSTGKSEEFIYEIMFREHADHMELFTRWYFKQGVEPPWKYKKLKISERYKIELKINQKIRYGYKLQRTN